jgi:hypothetical protein
MRDSATVPSPLRKVLEAGRALRAESLAAASGRCEGWDHGRIRIALVSLVLPKGLCRGTIGDACDSYVLKRASFLC